MIVAASASNSPALSPKRRAEHCARFLHATFRPCSTMKELALKARPREKLLTHGPSALGDNELLALVLGSGRRHSDALAVANELLAARDGLHGLSRSTPGDLALAPGIGPAKAAQILAAVELGRRHW